MELGRRDRVGLTGRGAPGRRPADEWDLEALRKQVSASSRCPKTSSWDAVEGGRPTARRWSTHLMELAEAAYDHKEQELGAGHDAASSSASGC